MTNELYLWDRSEPDDDGFVSKLEDLLAKKRALVQGAGRRRRPRLLQVVGGVAVAAAAALVAWLCVALTASDPTPGTTGDVQPPVALETSLPAGAPDARSVPEQAGGDKRSTGRLEKALGQTAFDAASPAATGTTR